MSEAIDSESGAFRGLRVLDLCADLPGSLVCMLLADMGADVLRVQADDDPGSVHPGFLCWNRNKRRAPPDRAHELALAADVLVADSVQPGLEPALLRASNPGLIYATLPPYGRTGPYADLPSDHALLAAMSGSSFRQFSWEDVPVYRVTPQLHYAHGILAASAIASCIYERDRSGKGQELSVSGLDAFAATSSNVLVRPLAGAGNLANLRRLQPGARGIAPNFRLYQCADGEWLFLGTLVFEHFVRALDVLDLLDIMVMEGIEGEFANVMRPENVGRVIARLDARFAERPLDDWMALLREHGVPCGPVDTRQNWFASETVAANKMRVGLDHPQLGRVELPGVPVKLSETPGHVRQLMRDAEPPEFFPRAVRSLSDRQMSGGVSAPVARGPLAGVRILDLGSIIAGPFTSTVLANFGADVIKVEPLSGDSYRAYEVDVVGINQGKRSLALDIKQAEGREAFYDLVRHSDVVCDNYRHGVLERLGIDYDTLRAVNPRIISVSVTGYGPVGPLSRDPGLDPTTQARSGLSRAQGGDDEPVLDAIAVSDVGSALLASFGIAVALHAREATGRGQKVETCLANAIVLTQSGELTWYEGREDPPLGGRDCPGISALQRLYPCADGWLALSCTHDDHYLALCGALGREDWSERWPPTAAGVEPRIGALAAALAEALAKLPRDHALELLAAARVPAAPAIRGDDVYDSPFFAANDFFQEDPHPSLGPMCTVRGFARFERTPAGFPRRSPLLGEHTREVLSDAGLTPDHITRLLQAGIVLETTERT
ncbi:MAG: CoA transferase [Haliea sp.]|uniref:CaiB/BaiF CoA-transferase family protein n=1 Tax=Haliea sp. TaxID=1932666 RepID=UPI0032EF5640